MDNLLNEGYIVIPNIKNKTPFEYQINEIYKNNKVDYPMMKKFIDDTYFSTLKNDFSSIENYKYGKFRFSNNNNSTDASTFHGDVYNHTDKNIIPVYTFLYYFDDATLEIIPNSHKKEYLNSTSSFDSFNNKKSIPIKAGSFVIFNSNIHHRGVNFSKTGQRRLLQIFDVFLNLEDYNIYSNKIRIVKTEKDDVVKLLSSFSKYIYSESNNDILTFILYLIVYNDMQYKIALIDLPPYEKKNNIISYEPGKRVNFENSKSYTDTNINIICDKNIPSVDPSNYYLYILLLLLFIFVIIVLYLYVKNYLKLKVIKKMIKKIIK